MACNRDKHKHGKDADDSDDDDGRVWFFLPSEGIDFDVLASDLRCYLGNGAQVEIGNHHRSGRPGYHIKSAVPITKPMIEDLKADSHRWRAERRKYSIRNYNDSYTHRSREANGPSQQAPTAASFKQSLEREKQNMPSQGAREPQAIPERRHEREEDLYRYPSIMSSSTESNILPRDPSQYPSSNPSRSEEPAYDHRSTAMMSKSSYNYSVPSKGFEHASRRHIEGTANIPGGGVSVNYRQTETTIEVNESAYERTAPGNQYSSQPRYTKQQIEEVERDIALALKDSGLPVSRHEFDRLVNDQLKRLYGSEQRQYQPKPLSSNQGGQKPPTGPVPFTQFAEQGGQKPSPGFVPFTQFAGSGGQIPPPRSVPYNQIAGSEKPPEATQPDYTSSYGFPTKYVTSGGPESNYPGEHNKSFFTEPPSQSYDSRSGKYISRDGHNTQR